MKFFGCLFVSISKYRLNKWRFVDAVVPLFWRLTTSVPHRLWNCNLFTCCCLMYIFQKRLPTATKNIHNIYDDDVMFCIHKTKQNINCVSKAYFDLYSYPIIVCAAIFVILWCQWYFFVTVWLTVERLHSTHFVSNNIWISHWIACRLFNIIALTTGAEILILSL